MPSVHPRRDYDVKRTRLSTFFLFGPLTTLMVFTCFRCDVANYHRKVRRTGDGLKTKLARNHNPFFLASIDYVWNDLPLFSSEKINLIHTRTKTNFQIKIQSFAF